MDLNELVEMQRRFDSVRETTFPWSLPISAENSSALTHNVLALAGEVGELANLVKKFDRGDFSFEDLKKSMPGELADILIYLIKISYQSGLDLEKAFTEKLHQNEMRFPASNET